MNISKKIEMIIPRPVNVEPARQTQMLMEKRWEEVKLKPGYAIVDVGDTTAGENGHVSDTLKIVCMSDTHSTLTSAEFDIPDGDIFIHAGDFTR